MDTWQRIGLALERPLVVTLPRDPQEEPTDAGHLRIQELLLRLGRRNGWTATFELPPGLQTRPRVPTSDSPTFATGL